MRGLDGLLFEERDAERELFGVFRMFDVREG